MKNEDTCNLFGTLRTNKGVKGISYVHVDSRFAL